MAVQQSPISTPRPELGPESKQPGPFTRREIWGYVFWGTMALFITVMELLAQFGTNVPFPTISVTAANLASRHPWVSIVYLGGLVVLAARITFYPWPNRSADR
jgi:hypothetical protein